MGFRLGEVFPSVCVTFALAFAVAASSGVAASCGPRELPPLGEVVLVVDTDLPVPRVASRLRVDTYTADAVWLDSRDIALPDARDWPASFSVQATDDTRTRDVFVRVRIYGERTSAYRDSSRLVRDGTDVTPKLEPAKGLAVDRLVALRLEPGVRGRARIVARGACAGTAAVVEKGGMRTCLDRDGELAEVPRVELEPELATPKTNVVGTVARTACPSGTDPSRVCVEGGAFVLGTDDVSVVPDEKLPLSPERIVRVSTFSLDRDEVTVGRFRVALAGGLTLPADVGTTEGDLGTELGSACTFSKDPRGREDYALTCVAWATARAFCTFVGGDLPSEVQWEYAATSAARSGKTELPWGDEPPTCDRAVYGRLSLSGFPGSCEPTPGAAVPEPSRGRGPLPVFVGGEPAAKGDVSAVGVRGLAGGVSEWTRDVAARYDAPCWSARATWLDPVCEGGASEAHVVRGGGWGGTPITVRSVARFSSASQTSLVGFRCAYGTAR